MKGEFFVNVYVTIHTQPLFWHAVFAGNDVRRCTVAAVIFWTHIAGQQAVYVIGPGFPPLL